MNADPDVMRHFPAALDHALGPPTLDGLGLDEVVSMTIGRNEPSRRVMEKLGMTRDPADDFDHPRLPDGELRRHVLYRITREQWARLSRG